MSAARGQLAAEECLSRPPEVQHISLSLRHQKSRRWATADTVAASSSYGETTCRVGNVSSQRSAVGRAVAGAALTVAGCGAPPGRALEQLAASTSPSPTTMQKHYAHGTGQLRMLIAPTAGPVGTVVSITATGCGDPDGQNHAVSFNPGFTNTLEAAHAGYQTAPIAARLIGQSLTASNKITSADLAASMFMKGDHPPSQFFVQCSDDLAEATFLITK